MIFLDGEGWLPWKERMVGVDGWGGNLWMERKFVDGKEVDGWRGFVVLNGTEGRLSGR